MYSGILVPLAALLVIEIIGISCNEGNFQYSPEDSMNTAQLAAFHGYPTETHIVTTEDGYIISLFRIPHGKTKAIKKDKPILLMHGLLDSSDTWVINFPKQSLGFILADRGYDVWLGNVRGNRYGRNHVSLSLDSKEFWNFSFEEYAKYDLTVFINYITKKTNSSKINYVGHSQGTMIGFIEFSRNDEIASKIEKFIALAPVETLSHCKGGIKVLSHFSGVIETFLKTFGVKEFLPQSFMTRYFANKICSSSTIQKYCANMFFLFLGFNSKSLNETRLPVYFQHTPAGTSSKNVFHFVQLLNSGKFQQYDYGYWGNYWKYGSFHPPKYDVSKMKTKVALFNGGNDWISTPQDVATSLLPNLQNVVYMHTIGFYNHLDFIWAIDANKQVYEKMMKVLEDNLE